MEKSFVFKRFNALFRVSVRKDGTGPFIWSLWAESTDPEGRVYWSYIPPGEFRDAVLGHFMMLAVEALSGGKEEA